VKHFKHGDRHSTVMLRAGRAKWVLTTPLVVGADGLRSMVAPSRTLRGRTAARRYGFSFDTGFRLDIERDVIAMYLVDGGFVGLVQEAGCVHLGAVAQPGQDPFVFVRSVAEHFPTLRATRLARLTRKDVSGFSAIGPMPMRARRVAGDRFALVGDAAGYVDPFTGEGMSWAIESADALCETFRKRGGEWSTGHARDYARRWRTRIGRGHRKAAIVSMAIRRPRLLRIAMGCGLPVDRFSSTLFESLNRPCLS